MVLSLMPALAFIITLTILLLSEQASTAVVLENPAAARTTTTCQQECGGISIPFPFGIGIGSNCSFNDWYTIICDDSFDPPKSFLYSPNNNDNILEVLKISVNDSTITVNSPIFLNCPESARTNKPINLSASPFKISSTVNTLMSAGCDNAGTALLIGEEEEEEEKKNLMIGGCLSYCLTSRRLGVLESESSSCHGQKSCQAGIPWPLKAFDVSLKKTSSCKDKKPGDKCSYAFIAEKKWVDSGLVQENFVVSGLTNVPAVLNWALYKGTCISDDQLNPFCGPNAHCLSGGSNQSYVIWSCDTGYGGNPYVECKDINECANTNDNICGTGGICTNTAGAHSCSCPFGHSYSGESCKPTIRKYIRILELIGTSIGLMFLLGCLWWLHREYKIRKENKIKKKYFKRNGGTLLQQQLSSDKDSLEKTKLFTSKELEKATDHYNENRILGHGGQGTVYKGMLMNGTIVAVKKAKLLETSKVKQFINEVVILSKINHRNVVKILGCCLETEFPILVYEFIPNGTLFQYIHDENGEFPFSWDMRLRIATEIAEALSYLHSASSMPIYHRDIKSKNILLDEKFKPKVADFGISKSILIDQTHITTMVQGTFGYLDPEYFQTNKFTEKSDVYSFGIVLVELLTSLEPIFSTTRGEETGLAAHFLLSMEQNCFFHVVDARIVKVARKGEIMAVANIARRCLNLNGKTRPTMKAVAIELERIRMNREACLSNKAINIFNAVKPNWCNPYVMLQLGQNLRSWTS